MRTLACKHKIWGGNWLYLRPYLKAFPQELINLSQQIGDTFRMELEF